MQIILAFSGISSLVAMERDKSHNNESLAVEASEVNSFNYRNSHETGSMKDQKLSLQMNCNKIADDLKGNKT